MEELVIQRNNVDLQRVDAFIRSICDACHIDNYYATIYVAVTKSIEAATSCAGVENAGSPIRILFDYTPQGILFTIVNSSKGFDPNNDSMGLVSLLADKVSFSDDATMAHLFFAVRGIEADEASRRVSVLNQFFKVAAAEKVYAKKSIFYTLISP